MSDLVKETSKGSKQPLDNHLRKSHISLTLVVIFVISLLLNYIWKSAHEAFLYQGFKFKADIYILMIMEAAFVDATLVLAIYLGVAGLWRDILWVRSMKWSQLSAAFAVGLITAVAIEYRGVLLLKEWAYLPAMPTIYGIGLAPLIQLSVPGVITFYFARRFLFACVFCR
jgi:hypothetical protein